MLECGIHWKLMQAMKVNSSVELVFAIYGRQMIFRLTFSWTRNTRDPSKTVEVLVSWLLYMALLGQHPLLRNQKSLKCGLLIVWRIVASLWELQCVKGSFMTNSFPKFKFFVRIFYRSLLCVIWLVFFFVSQSLYTNIGGWKLFCWSSVIFMTNNSKLGGF